MKIRIEGFKRLLVESALIVFSVLFALFINRMAENQKTQQQKQIALERIVQEMQSNRELIASAIQVHKSALRNLQKATARETDSLRIYLADLGYFDAEAIGLLLDDQSFYPQFPSHTSWQAAMATGIVSEFEYDVVENLTEVYDVQRFFIEETMKSITQVLFAPIEEERKTINTLLIQINELVQQEDKTIAAIDEALDTIHPSTTDP